MKEAKSIRSARSDERKEEVGKLANFVEESLEIGAPHAHYHFLCLNFGRSLGSYVSTLYIFVKLLYVVNIFTQFVILNNFLGTDYNLWGFQVSASIRC